jgi:hypothetical protein
MAVVYVNTAATGTIPSPLNLCFDASNTVTVGGGGSTFTVQNGARATMIAGVKISYLYGTTVAPGGYMHGYITTTNAYCGSLPPAMVAVVAGSGEVPPQLLPETALFNIYPNPTNGIFTISAKGAVITGKVQVDVFDMQGNRMLSTSYTGESSHVISLPVLSPGLYFLKVTSGDRIESFKLILTH